MLPIFQGRFCFQSLKSPSTPSYHICIYVPFFLWPFLSTPSLPVFLSFRVTLVTPFYSDLSIIRILPAFHFVSCRQHGMSIWKLCCVLWFTCLWNLWGVLLWVSSPSSCSCAFGGWRKSTRLALSGGNHCTSSRWAKHFFFFVICWSWGAKKRHCDAWFRFVMISSCSLLFRTNLVFKFKRCIPATLLPSSSPIYVEWGRNFLFKIFDDLVIMLLATQGKANYRRLLQETAKDYQNLLENMQGGWLPSNDSFSLLVVLLSHFSLYSFSRSVCSCEGWEGKLCQKWVRGRTLLGMWWAASLYDSGNHSFSN